ncbi:MAG: TA system VapC family ribonuclease toxin [Thermoanaerobaculia bacterium]
MIPLLDVNLFVALAWPSHVHHALAHRWFRRNHEDGWATCPLTQSGFVRVSCNRLVLPQPASPRDAVLLLRELIELPGHVFWSDDVSIARSQACALDYLTGHRQVTDAHLLALATLRGGRLATLDRRIEALVPEGVEPSEVLLLVQEAG